MNKAASLPADWPRATRDVTFLLGAIGAQAATLSDPQPNLFRFVADGAQSAAGLAAHAYTDLGWRRAALVMDPLPHELGAGGRVRGRVLRARRHRRAPLTLRRVRLPRTARLAARLSDGWTARC